MENNIKEKISKLEYKLQLIHKEIDKFKNFKDKEMFFDFVYSIKIGRRNACSMKHKTYTFIYESIHGTAEFSISVDYLHWIENRLLSLRYSSTLEFSILTNDRLEVSNGKEKIIFFPTETKNPNLDFLRLSNIVRDQDIIQPIINDKLDLVFDIFSNYEEYYRYYLNKKKELEKKSKEDTSSN